MCASIVTSVVMTPRTFLPNICEERHVQPKEFFTNDWMLVRKKRLQNAVKYQRLRFLVFERWFPLKSQSYQRFFVSMSLREMQKQENTNVSLWMESIIKR